LTASARRLPHSAHPVRLDLARRSTINEWAAGLLVPGEIEAFVSPLYVHGRGRQDSMSNRHAVAVEFVVLIVAALPASDTGKIGYEFYSSYPLNLFEAQLVLTP
jgi:hypothetical protein